LTNKPYSVLDGPRADLEIVTHTPPAEDKVSIIIVHRDRPEHLNICLQSVAVCSSNNNYELVVVDNASVRKESHDYLDDLQSSGDCKVVRNQENLYWAKAANIGAKAASKDSRYFVFLHDDTVILNPSWLDLLINSSDAEKSGHVGVTINKYSWNGQDFQYIEEWCMLVTRECWEDCGPFNEELPVIGSPFLFTFATEYGKHRPQATQVPIAHHYQNFSLDVNEYDRAQLDAREKLPKIMHKMAQRAGRRVAA